MRAKLVGFAGRPLPLLLVMMLICMYCASPAVAEELQSAPPNPAFLDYTAGLGSIQGTDTLSGSGDDPGVATVDGVQYPLGDVPDPLPSTVHDPDEELPARISVDGASASDSRYDMRDPNGDSNKSDTLLTPIRNQGACGACWAFATYGSYESHVKNFFGTADADNDYSENNLNQAHGFDIAPCNGGNQYMATAYTARGEGPLSEADDPYVASASASTCTTCSPQGYVQNVVFLPVRSSVTDNAYIKQNVISHGALYTSMYWTDSSYNSSTRTYYYNDPNDSFNDSNHAVVIVGWDDNKSVPGAPGSGAFLIRNSWGTSFGESGYFWISYHDESVAFSKVAYFTKLDHTNDAYDKIYQYDELGWVDDLGVGSTTIYGANRFTAHSHESLKAVSFYATGRNTSYQITIYGSFNGSSFSNALGTKSGVLAERGYYTIKLDTPIELQISQPFSVVVKFTTPGYTYPLPVERPWSGYSSAATAHSGESYYSSNGTTFYDITGAISNTNICIKAFTDPVTGGGNPAPGGGGRNDFNGDGYADILWRNHASGAAYLWHMNDATLISHGLILNVAANWTIMDQGDFNGDGRQDILWLNTTTNMAYVWLMNANAIVSHGSPGDIDGWGIQGVGDFNGDGKDDILLKHLSNGQTLIWYMNGHAFQSYAYLSSVSTKWKAEGVGDLDGDGNDDILWRDQTTGELHGWLMNGTSIKSSGSILTVPTTWSIEDTGDLNGDGKADILWRNNTSGTVYLWMMNGLNLASHGSILNNVAPQWQVQLVADYNNDGRDDILWRNTLTGLVYLWRMNGTTLVSHNGVLYVPNMDWQIQ